VPRFDLLDLKDYSILPIQTTRGCPFDCEFCNVTELHGHQPRHKRPDQVLAELAEIYRLGWRDDIFICDDNFIGSKVYASRLLQQLNPWMEDHGKPFSFTTQVSMNLGQELELIDLMTLANFSMVFIGIESPDEEVLKLTQKPQNVRHPLTESLNAISANGLSVIGSFIIGLDGEKPGIDERIIALVQATNIPIVMLNLLSPYPNTKLWWRLRQEGRLQEDRIHDISYDFESLGGELAYVPTRPKSQIMGEYLHLWDHLYDPERFLTRLYRYFQTMRPTRRALALRRGETAPKNSRPKPSLKRGLRELVCFCRLSWRYGVRPKYRLQYWSQLMGMQKNNPSRMVRYFKTLLMGESMKWERGRIHRVVGDRRKNDQ
jgi:radical SAM superfamily enzyme YgiQ (UPF0313 family)